MVHYCFCCLSSCEELPAIGQIAEALKHVVKLLFDKEAHEKSKLLENEAIVKKANQCVKELKTCKQSLSSDVERLSGLLDEAKQRAEFYKEKFLKIQQDLIRMHKTNQSLSKSRIYNSELQTGFPFSAEEMAKENSHPVVLAPDTCFTDSPEANVCAGEVDKDAKPNKPKDSSFRKPLQNVSIRQFFPKRMKSEKLSYDQQISKSLTTKCKNVSFIDPDETRIDKETCSDDDADEEFSIPASPVLSGKFVVSKKQETESNLEQIEDDRASPSLLKPYKYYKVSPLKSLFNEDDQLILGDNHDDSADVIHQAVVKHNDSMNISDKKIKTRALSPIHFEDDSEIERAMLEEAEHYTSLDELFNKTDGVLGQHTSGFTEANRTADDVREQASYVISDDNEKADLPLAKKQCISSCSKTLDKNGTETIKPFNDLDSEVAHQSVVRKQSERRKLEAKVCAQCQAYYSDLPDDEREKIIQEVCRHRYEFLPPSTPKHFWEIGIPSTAECKRRGYIKHEQDLSSEERRGLQESSNRRRRRKPYQAHFITKDK